MATSNSRDVTLTLSVDTLGEDNVKKLQASVQALAKEGGDAAPEFQKLADEIAQLGAQNTALQSFKALGDETQVLRDKQEALVQSSAQMAAKLDELRAATDSAKAGQSAASAALTAGRLAYVEAGNAIRILKTEYDASGKGTEEYRQKLNALTVAHAEAKAALVTLGAEQKATTAGASEAVSAQGKLETAYNRSVSAVNKVEAALKAQETALQQAATAANELGVSTAEIATSEAQLLSAFNAAGTAARTRAEATKEMAESDRLLAIEEQGLIALLARGEQALQAEVLAQRDAARAATEYAAAKAQATANEAKWQQEAEAIVNAAHAAQELARQTQVLAAAGKELSAQRAFEQQAEDAKKLVNAAEYVRMWETALQQADAQATATAAAASAAADKIQNAFKTVGVRSAQELQAEIVQVREAMATISAASGAAGTSLNGAFAAGEAKVRALELELRQLNGTLTLGDKATKLFANSMGQIALGNVVADAIGYLVNKVKEMGVAFIAAIVQMDQMRRGLNAIYGDARTTASQIDFLRKTASEAGVSFGGLGKEFVKFSASMTGANIPLAQSNALFKAVTTASATLGLNAEETAGSLNALGQMASKGVVSMEELRQQLGDRLPGAFGLVAKGLTLTEAQLVKLVESGGLAARDLFPALTRALGQMKGETDGLVPTFERLKGALTQFAQGVGDAGVTDILTAGLKALGLVISSIVGPLAVLTEGILGIARSAGILAAAAVTLTNPWDTLKQVWSDAGGRLSALATSMDGLYGVTTKNTGATQQSTAAMSASTAVTIATTKASSDLTASQKLQAISTALAGDNALDASTKYVRLKQEATDLLATQVKQSEASEKLAKAAKVEGDSLVALAQLSSNETAARDAAVVAATKYQVRLEEVAQSRQTETDLLMAQLVALEANRVAQGLRVEDIKVEKDALDLKLKSSQAETEQSKQAAAAAAIDTAQRKLSADTYRDTSARVDEYYRALTLANQALAVYQDRERAGLGTAAESAALKRNLAVAQALYKDALADSITKIQLETQAKTANLSIDQAKASSMAQAYTLQAQNSRALGDSAAALYYEIEAKKANIEQTRIGFAIKKLEADAEIAAQEIQKANIPLNDALRDQKIKEIDIRIQLAKVKLAEAGASDAIITAMEREITAMRNNANQRSGTTGTVSADTAARNENTAAIEGQTAALGKQKLTSDGFKTNKDGSAAGTFGSSLVVDKAFALTEQAKTGNLSGVSVADAKAAFDQAANAQSYQQKITAQDPGGSSFAFTQSTQALYNSTKAAYERVLAIQAEVDRKAKATANPATATTGTSSTKTVNVVINGVSTAVNVASASDQTALVSVIRQLEAAAKGTA